MSTNGYSTILDSDSKDPVSEFKKKPRHVSWNDCGAVFLKISVFFRCLNQTWNRFVKRLPCIENRTLEYKLLPPTNDNVPFAYSWCNYLELRTVQKAKVSIPDGLQMNLWRPNNPSAHTKNKNGRERHTAYHSSTEHRGCHWLGPTGKYVAAAATVVHAHNIYCTVDKRNTNWTLLSE